MDQPFTLSDASLPQMYFGLPSKDGTAHFARVIPAKEKALYRYAGDLELTFGEFMFDFMLDLEGNTNKVKNFFAEN